MSKPKESKAEVPTPEPKAYIQTMIDEACSFLDTVNETASKALRAVSSSVRLVPYLKAGNDTHGAENEADKRFGPSKVTKAGRSEDVWLVSNVQRKGSDSVFVTLLHLAVYLIRRAAIEGQKGRIYDAEFTAQASAIGLAPLDGHSTQSGSAYFALRDDGPIQPWLDKVTLPALPETFDGTGAGQATGAAMVMLTADEAMKARILEGVYMVKAPNYLKNADRAILFLTLNESVLVTGTRKNKAGQTVYRHPTTAKWTKAVKAIVDARAAAQPKPEPKPEEPQKTGTDG
jgi:hypothetical protein